MKKVILVMVLILPFVFQSFTDDENKNTLAGTTWVYTYSAAVPETPETHLKFTDDKNVETLYYDQTGKLIEGNTEHATYVVSGSHIVFTYDDGTTYSGTITGNKLLLVYDKEPAFTFSFVKN